MPPELLEDTVLIRRAAVAGPFRLREIWYGPSFRQPPHFHDVFGVTLVLSGAIRETAGSREELATPLGVVVKPAGVEHADLVGPRGANTLQILVGSDFARGLCEAASNMSVWRWIHGAPAARQLLGLSRALRLHTGASGVELENRVIDALAATAREEASDPARAPGWLRQIKEEVDDRLAEGPRVAGLAQAAGVHPVSLARAFRRHFGTSLTAYRRRERLRRAAQAIDASGSQLGRIAHESGYADHPHLCREFQRATGLTPSEFRRLVRGR